MSLEATTDYCAFTKAVEHLGDRWSLLIVRQLVALGPQGFNALAASLPGRISRSVLAAKLRKLEQLGLIARDPVGPARSAPYYLAPAGEQLIPTLRSLWQWAEQWVPEDPTMAQRDPSVIAWWLAHRVDVNAVPLRQVAIELRTQDGDADVWWLLLARGAAPTLCIDDPLIGEDRYVYVEADAAVLLPIARGSRSWRDAIADGSVRPYGEPQLVTDLPTWFLEPSRGARPAATPRVAVPA